MNAAAIRARSPISAPWTGRIYACRRALGGCHVQITLAHSGWSIYATEPPGDRGTRLAMGSLLRECAHRGQHRRHNCSCRAQAMVVRCTNYYLVEASQGASHEDAVSREAGTRPALPRHCAQNERCHDHCGGEPLGRRSRVGVCCEPRYLPRFLLGSLARGRGQVASL